MENLKKLKGLGCCSGIVEKKVKVVLKPDIDIQLNGVMGFELSFPSRIGMSGGPVITDKTNKTIGMLSLGLPADCDIKKSTFAVSSIEISRFVGQS